MKERNYAAISKNILSWHSRIDRSLPWKVDRDPYKIWLSEIIMQQTRVEQGTPYYLRFVERFPTVESLAAAPIDEILKAWEGLGYYQRARNLHFTARQVALENNGNFPDTYEGLLALKGVGTYTAAAIASFAYDLPYAVVDGNVIRVLARVAGIDAPVNAPSTVREIQSMADRMLPPAQGADFNQAIMDFGALLCRPKNPHCGDCPIQSHCRAHAMGEVHNIPKKKPKKPKRKRYFHYLIFNLDDQIFIRKRRGNDIWKGLYEFYLIEHEGLLTTEELDKVIPFDFDFHPAAANRIQQLSHQTIECMFLEARIQDDAGLEDYERVDRKQVCKYAFPRALDWYLNDKAVTLNLLF
ncbi:MAG: A/G-specific adenine glycosylase [Saprospiraceae bacterium]|nr:A/G-specific adenine glycosylase [Saprospiraceae bacterium]